MDAQAKLNQRMMALRLTLDGLRPDEIAPVLGITASSVRRILRDNPDVYQWAMGPTGYFQYPARKKA